MPPAYESLPLKGKKEMVRPLFAGKYPLLRIIEKGAGEKDEDEKFRKSEELEQGRRRGENDEAKVEAGDTFHSISPTEAFYHSA